MHYWILFFCLTPLFLFSQPKPENERAFKVYDQELQKLIETHVTYLSSDALEGRRAGTVGERQAAKYLIKQYKKIGIQPAGSKGYLQPFEIFEGKIPTPNSFFKINERSLSLNEDYFPLPYSKTGLYKYKIDGSNDSPSPPIFVELSGLAESNANNPHFDWEDAIQKQVKIAIEKKASAIFFYQMSEDKKINLTYNKKDKTPESTIPVVFLHKKGMEIVQVAFANTYEIQLDINFQKETRIGNNVVGFIDNHASNTVILGAHYDHLGFGEDKNSLDASNGIHNGADDNASGSAALLALAKLLKEQPLPTNNYLIIHFSAEELGLLGSKYWLENSTKEVRPNYMINLDMVGRYDTSKKLTIGGYGTSPTWGQIIPRIPTTLQYRIDSSGSGPSDHASFYRKDIPVLFFFTGTHTDYHKETDDANKINFTGITQITTFIYSVIAASGSVATIPFLKTKDPAVGRSTKFTVSLGIIPDYAYSGSGVRIDGISSGKLAEKIGLKAGDVLLKLGDIILNDINEYMQGLAKFKKGDTTSLVYKRGKKKYILTYNFRVMKLSINLNELSENFFENTRLFGISTSLKNYQFCMLINNILGYNFRLNTDLEITFVKNNVNYFFSIYQYYEKEVPLLHSLYQNVYNGEFLVPDFKQLDLLWLMKSNLNMDEQCEWIKNIVKKLNGVLMIVDLTNEPTKSKVNMIL